MTKFERIAAHVPVGTVLPVELRMVCDYLDRTGYPISGCMKIRPDDFGGVQAWFDGDEAMASQFAYFGAGPDGSILAFWLRDSLDAGTVPIVHLGSEGNGNSVLARNFREFLQLFGIGYDELGFDDLSQRPADPDSAAGLRAWLEAELGIICPPTGEDIVTAARLNCADVAVAIEHWIHQRYRSQS
ncbi:hypothetical protein ACDH70_11780 [Xanthomonas axonopodis pv. poinsettiicola]|uniref:hypothetical protein n=1 Tax=Xanthomonas TaxID=338 RepID=UPI001E3C30A8|nr:hypothetical protein [Xanthomonas codiaei]MCC8539443.1 hypothetical protein [Xanthomonas codiaei]